MVCSLCLQYSDIVCLIPSLAVSILQGRFILKSVLCFMFSLPVLFKVCLVWVCTHIHMCVFLDQLGH